jgi:nitroreductase
MDVFEAIRTRRTISQVTPECPPRHVIEEIIEDATWAPNHHRVEPWGAVFATSQRVFTLPISGLSPEQETQFFVGNSFSTATG